MLISRLLDTDNSLSFYLTNYRNTPTTVNLDVAIRDIEIPSSRNRSSRLTPLRFVVPAVEFPSGRTT